MSPRRIGALALRIVRQFRRDRRTVAFLVLVPILVLWLLGLAFRSPKGPVRLGLAYHGPESLCTPSGQLEPKRELALRLQEAGFEVKEVKEEELEAALREGRLEVGLAVDGEKFIQGLSEGEGEGLRVIVEGADPTRSSVALAAFGQALRETLARLQIPGSPGGSKPQLEVHYVHGGPTYDLLDYFAPAFIGFFVFFFVLILACIAFLRERSRGTMERLMASPLRRIEIMLGYMLGFGLFAVMQSGVVLLYTIYGLKIRYAGTLWLAFLVELLLTIAAVNLGMFLSAYAHSELQAVQFIPLVILPQAFLSGIVWRIEDMPWAFRGVARALPLTYANWALRDVMVRGKGLVEVGPNLLALLLFALAMTVLGALMLRKELA